MNGGMQILFFVCALGLFVLILYRCWNITNLLASVGKGPFPTETPITKALCGIVAISLVPPKGLFWSASFRHSAFVEIYNQGFVFRPTMFIFLKLKPVFLPWANLEIVDYSGGRQLIATKTEPKFYMLFDPKTFELIASHL